MERKCEHSNHLKNLKESIEDPFIYRKGNEVTIAGTLSDTFIETKKYGTLCGVCYCVEFGKTLEELADENGRIPIIPHEDDPLNKYDPEKNR